VAENILVLTPAPIDSPAPDRSTLVEMLRDERFIGEPITIGDEEHFRPGEEFMMLITFLGCSPMIATGEMESEGEQYCHIAIDGPLESPRYLIGDNIKPPRCPGCGHRLDKWRLLLDAWQCSPNAPVTCPDCGEAGSITALRWRKCAGFGRLFIKIWGVFENEAVPSPNLLSSLKQSSGTDWIHFYIRNN